MLKLRPRVRDSMREDMVGCFATKLVVIGGEKARRARRVRRRGDIVVRGN